MNKQLWLDLEDFAEAFRKEVPRAVKTTLQNIVGVALQEDRFGKSRFELLCARIPKQFLPYDNHLDTELLPVMIRAIQGHSDKALKRAGGLYASAQLVYCAEDVGPERKAAFTGVPICRMDQVPEVAYHRTMHSHWKSIVKSGLLPGGGDSVNSGRAHIYLSEARFGADGYRSGLRGKCPIELKIAMRQAVKSGVIMTRSSMDGISGSERIPSQFVISVYDTEADQLLWTRANSNLSPDDWLNAATSPSAGGNPVSLVARDDRDPNDDADDEEVPSPPAQDPDEEGSKKRSRTHQGKQPPSQVRRVYLKPQQKEPFTGNCPLCMVEYVSGQVTCTTCGYEPLPIDESGTLPPEKPPNRLMRTLEKRKAKLAEFNIFGEVDQSLLAALTGEQSELLKKEIGPRGFISYEGGLLRECRDRFTRAVALGYEGVEDRYGSDVTFCDRVHGEGKTVSDCIFDDMFAHAHLPDPHEPTNRFRWASQQDRPMSTA